MNNLIDRLYDEIYAPKVNPEQLMNNALLPNYQEVKASANSQGLMIVTVCTLEDGAKGEYYYQFDQEKKLIELYAVIEKETELIYSRKRAIEREYNNIKKYIHTENSKKAI